MSSWLWRPTFSMATRLREQRPQILPCLLGQEGVGFDGNDAEALIQIEPGIDPGVHSNIKVQMAFQDNLIEP